ncbi:MAG: acyltransferase family protein [Panacagrimonas sp.]
MQQESRSAGEAASAFRPDIEGLRAVAILLVVAYHAGLSWVPGGYVGVDVFFVVSGYLITGLLVREIETTGRLDFARFYARRARRLLPAAVLVVLVTLLAANFVYSPNELRALANSAIAMSLYVSNLWFARGSTDYLAADEARNALLHSWSLSVEEQFYLVWPIFIFLAYRGLRAGTRHRTRLIVAMAGLGLLSLIACIWLTRQAQPWAFFASPTRGWEFAAGGLAALVPMQWVARYRLIGPVLQGFGLVAVVIAGSLFDGDTQFPGYAALLPALGTALLLTGFVSGAPHPITNPVTAMLDNPVMHWIGRRSYSWYLWHWPVLVLADVLIPQAGVVAKLACVGLSLVLADASYRLLENPIRVHPLLVPRKVLSLGLAMATTALCVSFAGGWRQFAVAEAHSPDQAKFTNVRSDIPHIYRSDCHLDLVMVKVVACEFGDRSSHLTLVLFGDSHAAQWFPGLEDLAARQGWRLIPLTKSGCPPMPVRITNLLLGRVYEECERWREEAMAKILRIRPDLILIGQDVYSDTDVDSPDSEIDSTEWLRGQRQLLSRFDRAGLETAVIQNTPRPGFDVPKCLARQVRFGSRASTCGFDRDNAQHTVAHDLSVRAAENLDRVSFIDLTQAICPKPRCEGMDPLTGIVRYRDDHHLSGAFVVSLAAALEAAVVPLMPES